MSSILHDIWYGTVLLPFTAGNFQERHNGKRYHDGTISVAVLVLCLLAVIFVFTISQSDKEGSLVRVGVLLSLLACMVFTGLLASIAIGGIVKFRGFDALTRTRTSDSPTLLRTCFLWLFGIGTVMYCLLKLIRQGICNQDIFIKYMSVDSSAEMAYYVLVALFVVVEMIFMSVFIKTRFKHSAFIHYSMLCILSANCSVWFYTFLLEKNIVPVYSNETSASLIDCMTNSSVTKVINASYPILSPMFLEFSLVTITMLLEIWAPVNTRGRDSNVTVMYSQAGGSQDDTSPLVESRRFASDEFSRSFDNAYRESVNKSMQFYGLVFTSVLIYLPMFIGFVLQTVGSTVVRFPIVALDVYLTIYKSILLIAVLNGFFWLVHSCVPVADRKSMRVREYMLLFAAFGLFQFHVFRNLSGAGSPSESSIILGESVISIIVDYLQTTFLIQANRYIRNDSLPKKEGMELTCLLLMLMNFGLWLIDSFVGGRYLAVHSKDILGDIQWNVVHAILYPITVFYRFTVSFGYHRLYHYHSKN